MDKLTKKLIIIVLILLGLFLFFQIFPNLLRLVLFLFKIILPFLLGFSLSFMLMPAVRFFQKRKIPHKISVIVVVSITGSILFFLFYYTIPLIFNQIGRLVENLPNIVVGLEDFLVKISEHLAFLPAKYQPTPSNIETFVRENLNNFLSSATHSFSNIFSYLSIVLLTPVLTIYFLFDYEKIENIIKKFVTVNHYTNLRTFLVEIKHTMEAYFKGVFLVMFLMSVICWILFSIIDLDYSLLMGLIIGITNVIPYLGPYLGGAVVAIYALSYSTNKAISVIIIVAIVQLVESNLITPFIQSRRVKTHPILVVLSMTFFGALMGIFGLLIAVPVLAIIQTIIRYIIKNRSQIIKNSEID